jgi:Ca-activated chloride channel family protein
MISFGAPQWCWALLFVPVFVLLYVRGERQTARRLHEFVAANLLPNLARTVNYSRRVLRFALLVLAFACGVIALAEPRWGYTFEEAKRRGLDVLMAIDTSRSMLSNDVQPNRLTRVKLAAHDLIDALQGDRVGLIAFAGRAFVQAPLTIDYAAAADAVDDLDTNTIPEGGTNISDAIKLAQQTFGKSAIGNRALVVFTDGEELSGDAKQTAKAAADAGVRIFTIGVGTPEGSLIPVPNTDGGIAFVKDNKGQVVKSKLDETRLREVAQESGGVYLHLENGPATIKQLVTDGLSKMQSGDINARMSRRPIERYQWPLGAACLALGGWFLVAERKRVRSRVAVPIGAPVAAFLMLSASDVHASAPGINEYRSGRYSDALQEFEQTLQSHAKSAAADKLQFDRGAAAFKLKDYNKALDSFSQALLSPDTALQSRSHYNLGNTLYERGEAERADDKKMTDWRNALQHYEQTLKIEPQNKEAKENYEFVKNKIDELKRKKQQQPSPSPSPSPSPQQPKNKQNDKDQQQQQQQQSADKDQQQKQESGEQDQQKPSPSQNNKQQPSPSPSDSGRKGEKQEQQPNSAGASPSPSPTAGEEQQKDEQSENGGASPSPSAGEGEGQSPSPGPSASPNTPKSGELKGASESNDDAKASENAEVAQADVQKDGEMSAKQAELLLRSMKNEEKRVQLDERKAARHVYNDW